MKLLLITNGHCCMCMYMGWMTVSNGGWLFQHYLECNARAEDFKDYHRALSARTDDVSTIEMSVQDRLIEKYKAGFVLWLLTAAGVPAYQQLFYLIFVLEYKGLSRSGIDMLHRMQASLSLRSYDSYRKAALESVDATNRYPFQLTTLYCAH